MSSNRYTWKPLLANTSAVILAKSRLLFLESKDTATFISSPGKALAM